MCEVLNLVIHVMLALACEEELVYGFRDYLAGCPYLGKG